jgi:subtilisin-like proprotein convertase family protein
MRISQKIPRLILISRCGFAILVALLFIFTLLHLAGTAPAQAAGELVNEANPSFNYTSSEDAPLSPLASSVVSTTTFIPVEIGTSFRSVAVGDFNGDNYADLVLGIPDGSSNSVYLNDGAGGWTSFASGPINVSGSIAVGDMNGDGRMDIVQGSKQSHLVVHYNNGGGSWSDATVGDPGYISVGDLDNDGCLDIIRWNVNQLSVIFYNNGISGWITQTLGVAHDTYKMIVADMNNDGRLDIVQNNDVDQIIVYFNQGSHTWSSKTFAMSGNSFSLAVGDLDGNGLLDIVRGGFGGTSKIYYNNGGEDWTMTELGSVLSTRDIAIGDMNGDGLLDIVQANQAPARNYIYFNDGAGSWTAVPLPYDLYLSYNPCLALGDINRDGMLDIVLGDETFSGVVYYTSGATGWLAKTFSNTTTPGSLAVGDMNNDGSLDIVQFNYINPSYVYTNDGFGGWSASSVGTPDFFTNQSIALADMNGDKRLDIVWGGHDAHRPQASKIYFNNGGGTYSEVAIGDPAYTLSIAVGDLNGDGRLDIVQANESMSSVMYYQNVDGSFTKATLINSTSVRFSLIGDLNGDSWLDIVLGGSPTLIYTNDGAGGWITSTLSYSGWAGALGDVNGDGRLDILLGQGGLKSIILYNNGASGWTPTSFGTRVEPTSMAIADINGDGRQEIIQGNSSGTSYIYINDGKENWAQVKFSEIPKVLNLALGDLNKDGRLDIVEGVVGSKSVVYYQPNLRGYPNSSSNISLVRPVATGNADFFSTPILLGSTVIPITYTISDAEGDPLNLLASYSFDGGGHWHNAIAASGTLTTNLTPRRSFPATSSNVPITITDNGVITSTLNFTSTGFSWISDVKVWVYVNHPQSSDLRLILQSPNGTKKVTLFNPSTLSGSLSRAILLDAFAPTSILSATLPYRGAYRPTGLLTDFNGLAPAGTWKLRVEDTHAGSIGALKAWGIQIQKNNGTYVFQWDTFKSQFFGQSDSVVFRLDAIPSSLSNQPPSSGKYYYYYQTPPYPYIHSASTTFPFRVRGAQVRVMEAGSPADGAIVYDIPSGQSGGGLPFIDTNGKPYQTNLGGYLAGRGTLGLGDTLAAMLPITHTNTYTLNYTNITPSPTGLEGFTVSAAGVQTITVSSAHPFILFNLDVSLQWDARNDNRFLPTFEYNLQRTSELLYDWTNGQAALGNIRVYHNREHWNDAHLRVYASNQMRPNAVMGGIVSQPITETAVTTLTYAPGQVHMGAVWNRYGEASSNLGEDWPRTLAHELGHYLLYLDDDYLGLDTNNQLIPVDGCPSAMADPYRQDYLYDEFHPDAAWPTECANTLSNQLSGRSDWGTIHHFYNWLGFTSTNPGPTQLPLLLTQIMQIDPGVPLTTLEDPTFYLSQSSQRVQPGEGTRAFLYQDGWAIDLGSPTLDHILARGARPQDQVCVYELPAQRLGCTVVIPGNEQLPLSQVSDWQPDINATAVNSQTISLEVSNLPTAGLSLEAQLYPMTSQAPQPISLTLQGSVYTGTFHLSSPVFEGFMRVMVENTNPVKEMITDFAVGGNPVSMRGSNTSVRGNNVSMRGSNTPVTSADGQVILYVDSSNFAPNQFYTLQSVSNIPSPILWANVVGRAYRLTASPDAPDLSKASISFSYLGDEVPTGGEPWLRLYFWDGNGWSALDTSLDMYHNNASAPANEPGIYALMSSIEIPIYGPGWNLVSYPLQVSQPITQALLSINGHFNTVYHYDASNTGNPWKVYAVSAPQWVNDLHNMEFGKGYWINAVDNIPWYLSPRPNLGADYGVPIPPTTFYGQVLPSLSFNPTVGMNVTAWVDGHNCGTGTMTNIAGYGLAYVVKVFADDGATYTGCGQTNRTVTFSVQGRIGASQIPWDNSQVWEVLLQDWSNFIGENTLFLPCVTR